MFLAEFSPITPFLNSLAVCYSYGLGCLLPPFTTEGIGRYGHDIGLLRINNTKFIRLVTIQLAKFSNNNTLQYSTSTKSTMWFMTSTTPIIDR